MDNRVLNSDDRWRQINFYKNWIAIDKVWIPFLFSLVIAKNLKSKGHSTIVRQVIYWKPCPSQTKTNMDKL